MDPMDRLVALVADFTGKTITSCSLASLDAERPWPARLVLATADGRRLTIDVGSIEIATPGEGVIKGMDAQHARAQLLAMSQ